MAAPTPPTAACSLTSSRCCSTPTARSSGIINYIVSRRAGGPEQLKGKKIVVLYHGSPYGKETIPIYELLAQKYGFDRAADRGAASRQRAAVAMADDPPREARLCRAARLGRDESGGAEDRAESRLSGRPHHRQRLVQFGGGCASRPATPPRVTPPSPPRRQATQYPVLQEIIKTVYGAGKGNLDDKKRIGSVYHNLGIVNGILNVEAIRIAQEKFGHRTLTGDEVRWGFEHLQLDPARVEALGAKDLFHSINVTWDNHEGDGYVTFQQWDGKKWNVVSDWIAPDWELLRPIIEKSAASLCAAEGIKVRTCRRRRRRHQLTRPRGSRRAMRSRLSNLASGDSP